MDLFLVIHLKAKVKKSKKISAFPISRERPSLKKKGVLLYKRWIL